MAKQRQVVFKTKPQKTPTQYRELSKDQLEDYREKKISELHKVNEWVRIVWNCRDDDYVLTMQGYRDVPYHVQLSDVWWFY